MALSYARLTDLKVAYIWEIGEIDKHIGAERHFNLEVLFKTFSANYLNLISVNPTLS